MVSYDEVMGRDGRLGSGLVLVSSTEGMVKINFCRRSTVGKTEYYKASESH